MIGVLGARSIGHLAAYAAIGSMGTLLVAISLFTPAGIVAALFYMVHSTLAGAALFLVADMVRSGKGGEDRLIPGPGLPQNGLIASLFFVAAIAMAGLPPLSGFLGKLLVLDAARDAAWAAAIWAAILAGSLVAVVGFARGGSVLFWHTTDDAAIGRAVSPLALTATFGLVAMLAALTLFAGPVSVFLEATASQLMDRDAAIAAILPPEAIIGGETLPEVDAQEAAP
jgi:multicomponent K+:H+ antiporter subunit D